MEHDEVRPGIHQRRPGVALWRYGEPVAPAPWTPPVFGMAAVAPREAAYAVRSSSSRSAATTASGRSRGKKWPARSTTSRLTPAGKSARWCSE